MPKELGAYITTTLLGEDGNGHSALTTDFIPAEEVTSSIATNSEEFYKVACETGFVQTIRWVEREIPDGKTTVLRH